MTTHRPSGVSHGWLIANLLAQISLGLLAMTICLPSMQEWGAIFKADQADVQLTFSAYVVAYGAFQLVYGPMSDRYGRKGVLLAGLIMACAGSWMAGMSEHLGALTFARFLQGAGTAAGMVVGRSTVQDIFQGPARTRVMAYIGMALGVCPPLATLMGGQIHVRWGWQANFFLMGALSIVLFFAAWWGVPSSRKTQEPMHWLRSMFQAYSRLARERQFLLYVVILATTTATFYVFLAGAPIVLRSYGVGPDGVGWFIMCVPLSYIVGNFLTSRIIHRVGERRLMQTGQALSVTAVLLVLLLAMMGWASPWAISLPLLLLGFGHGFLNPPALSGTVGLVPSLAGTAVAMAGLMQQLMGAMGGYLIGLVSHEGSVNLALMMLAFTLCSVVAQAMLHRR
jgi:DHA1 family bicyclomycin/chloramphenicol resistance-like MFS transporter